MVKCTQATFVFVCPIQFFFSSNCNKKLQPWNIIAFTPAKPFCSRSALVPLWSHVPSLTSEALPLLKPLFWYKNSQVGFIAGRPLRLSAIVDEVSRKKKKIIMSSSPHALCLTPSACTTKAKKQNGRKSGLELTSRKNRKNTQGTKKGRNRPRGCAKNRWAYGFRAYAFFLCPARRL